MQHPILGILHLHSFGNSWLYPMREVATEKYWQSRAIKKRVMDAISSIWKKMTPNHRRKVIGLK